MNKNKSWILISIFILFTILLFVGALILHKENSVVSRITLLENDQKSLQVDIKTIDGKLSAVSTTKYNVISDCISAHSEVPNEDGIDTTLRCRSV